MTRALPIIAILLLALVLLSRVMETGPATPPTAPAAAVASSTPAPSQGAAGRGIPPRPRAAPAEPGARPPTPELDRLVALASRQRIAREERYTYIDSLLASTDSLVRRWDDRNGRALRVALIDAPDLPGWRPILPTIARRAFAAWQEVYPDLRFEVVTDPATAEITIHWIERFEIERTGQTDLQYLPTGVIQHADIQLALETRDSLPLGEGGLAAVATHEVGHALGLPHSGSARDVMFPDTRTGAISSRDRATLVLLYAVPPGSLRIEQ